MHLKFWFADLMVDVDVEFDVDTHVLKLYLVILIVSSMYNKDELRCDVM